jgi:hypothetical protein
LESDVCITPKSRHHPNIIATALDHSPDGRGLLAVEHRAEIAHVEPSAARFTFENKVGLHTHAEIAPRVPQLFHGTLGVRKKVILLWPNLKSALLHKTGPSGLRKRCYAEEISWNIKE